MQKFFNILFLILILFFFGSVYKYYSSNNIIQIKDFNRDNINEIFNNKISNLPILENDTFNVIEFNDGFSVEIKDDKPRSFWNLLKSK
tara:strand:+ start:36 stop:299 length:264 start_codon:yes stop_codon:yes gene_type:complete